MHDAPIRPSTALVAYAEPLVEGRRVLVFGDASSSLAEHLLDRGARLIHVYDPDPARVAQAATRNTERRITFAPLSEGGLAAREGAFDLALVENLSAIPHPSSALRSLRRALSSSGVALVATPNPDAEQRLVDSGRGSEELDYYGLYDAVSAELGQVRMLGQTPFVGYAIVDFAPEGEPVPAFDSGFVPGGAEEPEQYIAVGSNGDVDLEEMAIIQLPIAAVGASKQRESASETKRAERAERRIAQLEAELGRARKNASDPQKLEEMRSELEKRDSWIRELESRAAAADSRADDAEAELERLREKAAHDDEAEARLRAHEVAARAAEKELALLKERLDEAERLAERAKKERDWAEERVQGLQEELEAALQDAEEAQAEPTDPEALEQLETAYAELKSEKAELEATLEKKGHKVEKLEKKLHKLEKKLEKKSDEESEDVRRDVAALEAQLVDRGNRVGVLEREIQKLERYGRELVAEIEALRAGAVAPDDERAEELETQLNQLAQINAAHEADLVAADWAIAELRDKLSSGVPAQVAVRLGD